MDRRFRSRRQLLEILRRYDDGGFLPLAGNHLRTLAARAADDFGEPRFGFLDRDARHRQPLEVIREASHGTRALQPPLMVTPGIR